MRPALRSVAAYGGCGVVRTVVNHDKLVVVVGLFLKRAQKLVDVGTLILSGNQNRHERTLEEEHAARQSLLAHTRTPGQAAVDGGDDVEQIVARKLYENQEPEAS